MKTFMNKYGFWKFTCCVFFFRELLQTEPQQKQMSKPRKKKDTLFEKPWLNKREQKWAYPEWCPCPMPWDPRASTEARIRKSFRGNLLRKNVNSLKLFKWWHVCKEKKRTLSSHWHGEWKRRAISEGGINSTKINTLGKEYGMGRRKEKIILKQK